MRGLLIFGPLLIGINAAEAQDSASCFSKYTKYNVCEKARELQAALAPTLPMKMNANITMSAVSAAGPRVIVIGIWNSTKSQMEETLKAGNLPLAHFQERMQRATTNSVCSQTIMPAFIRLGGQVQYIYKTGDQYVFASPVVTACENSN